MNSGWGCLCHAWYIIEGLLVLIPTHLNLSNSLVGRIRNSNVDWNFLSMIEGLLGQCDVHDALALGQSPFLLTTSHGGPQGLHRGPLGLKFATFDYLYKSV